MFPALPFVAIGIAAAAAGWAGANWWARLRGELPPGMGASEPGGYAPKPRRPTDEVRQLAWCPACRTYFVAGCAQDCGAPDCPRDKPGDVP